MRLRIHEGMVPDSANGAMFAEIMQVLERICNYPYLALV